MAPIAVFAQAGVTTSQRKPFLFWPAGSVFIPVAWIAAGWMERTFSLSPASFMAAGSAHGSRDLSREIPNIPS